MPERRVDVALVDGIRLPAVLGAPLAGAFRAVLERSPARRPADEPAPVRPGSHRPLGQLGNSLTEP